MPIILNCPKYLQIIMQVTPTNDNTLFLLNFIQQQASIGTWEYHVEEEALQWSDETKRIHELSLDYEPEIASGISFYKEGYSRETIKKLFADCLEHNKNFDEELEIVTAKGSEKWVRAIGMAVMEDGKCIKVQGLFQDIDEKTKNIKALAFKEEQLSKTFENAVVGMAILDLNGQWIEFNKSLCHIFGYKKEELQRISYLDITHPEDLKYDYQAMAKMMKGTKHNYEAEKRFIGKNGNAIWALLSMSIIRDDDGKPQHFVAQINDLTHMKIHRDEVNQLLETTENQNKRLLNFAHIVSHNLRSHYSNLDMLLDLVKIDYPDNTKNDIFPHIEEAVSHLGETVENLNEVASINIKNAIMLEPINLLGNLNKVIKGMSALILDSKTIVVKDIEQHLRVMAIPAYLDSILLNFLTNAIKYKKPGKPAHIHFHTEITEDHIILHISDQGLGIDLEKHGKKLFGMYKTFHNHKDSRGLGLFITKNQVEALGGKIEVTSQLGTGTTFSIYLKKHE